MSKFSVPSDRSSFLSIDHVLGFDIDLRKERNDLPLLYVPKTSIMQNNREINLDDILYSNINASSICFFLELFDDDYTLMEVLNEEENSTIWAY